MLTKIQKWGNSLGIRIPKALAQEVRIDEGASVNLTVENGPLIITPAAEKRYDLADLLGRVSPDNLHGETDAGPAAGREIW